MRLCVISEDPVSRRDFLKKSAGALASASPLGKLLLSFGFAPAVVQAVQSGSMAVPFTVSMNPGAWRTNPPMSSQFQGISNAANLVRSLGKVVGLGSDPVNVYHNGDFMVGELRVDSLARVLEALSKSGTVRIHGRDYSVATTEKSKHHDEYIELVSDDMSVAIYKNGLPEYVKDEIMPLEPDTNPIAAWWNSGHGLYSKGQLDPVAKRVMQDLGLQRSDAIQKYIDTPDLVQNPMPSPAERTEAPERNETADWDREYAAPMHQWFESKLSKCLRMV